MECLHNTKKIWEIQKFSKALNTEYEYTICLICKEKNYTGNLRMISVEETLVKKLNNEKSSKTSKKIKRLYTKSGKSLSLKEFARIIEDNELSTFWFDNKKSIYKDKKMIKDNV